MGKGPGMPIVTMASQSHAVSRMAQEFSLRDHLLLGIGNSSANVAIITDTYNIHWVGDTDDPRTSY